MVHFAPTGSNLCTRQLDPLGNRMSMCELSGRPWATNYAGEVAIRPVVPERSCSSAVAAAVPMLQRLRPVRSHCFAAYDVRSGSVDELLGRTTGRLGYTGPTLAHAIGGTEQLELRYSLC